MEASSLALAGSFCWNPACTDYAKTDPNNLIKFGFTRKGVPRLCCKTCGKTFAITQGTLFHGRRHSQATILECLALLAERTSLRARHRVKGIQEETVLDWLPEAATQVEQVEALLLARHRLTRVPLDALWTYVGRKGQKGGDPKPQSRATSGAVRP
jgi:transposase-like protein